MSYDSADVVTSKTKLDKFRKVLFDNGWTSDEPKPLKFHRDDLEIIIRGDCWTMHRGEEQLCEASITDKAYGVVESALEKLQR